MRILVSVVAALLTWAASAHADARLPAVFGDHMVLQRDRPVRIWGWADPGETVRVTLGPHASRVEADTNGAWQVVLPAMKAGGPHRLTVRARNTLRIDDVMVGEVWLCSGQSNMEWPLERCADAKAEIAAARDSRIRHFKVPHRASGTPLDDVDATWEACSPETAGRFSGAAYFMARALRKELRVPVGLLNVSWGGTRIEPWIAPEGLEAVPSLAALATRARTAAGTEPRSRQQATVLYNGMLHPLLRFPMRGAIWYQGEANHAEGASYTDKKEALIGGWRALWKQGDFPFYFVQIAPFRYGTESPEVLPAFWEAQAAVLRRVPGTGMVVTNDIATVTNIHPPNKQDVGDRLARLALRRTYDHDVEDSGPTYRDMQVTDGAVRVRFDHAQGLRTRDGKQPTHFEIAGATTGFVPADARIVGDSVILSAQGVPEPLAMRFAWHKEAEPNLVNAAGLPAGAFRAGSIPKPDLLGQVEDARGYTLVYDLDLANLGSSPRYDVDAAARVDKPFDRVAYLLELQSSAGGEPQYLWVSMDAFTRDATRLRIPAAATGTVFQQAVRGLTVRSNVEGIEAGTGLTGSLEFWASNYGPQNSAGVAGASPTIWDFGDQPAGDGTAEGYGSMQVHRPDAGQTLFAINHWSAGTGADLGIGNSSLDARTRDWTFARNAGSYVHKRLRVFVRMR